MYVQINLTYTVKYHSVLRTLHNIFLHEQRQGFAPTPGHQTMGFRPITNPRKLRIEVRLNEDERYAIEANAQAAHLGLSDYMRKCALKKRLASHYEIRKINNLRRLVDTIRDVVPASEGELKEALRDILRRTAVAIDEL